MLLSPKAHATFTLNARKIREFLIANPGSTNDEVRAATGHGVTRLQHMGLAYFKREDGKVKWYHKEGVSRPKQTEGDWRWDPNVERWESKHEVIETKWEAYKP